MHLSSANGKRTNYECKAHLSCRGSGRQKFKQVGMFAGFPKRPVSFSSVNWFYFSVEAKTFPV